VGVIWKAGRQEGKGSGGNLEGGEAGKGRGVGLIRKAGRPEGQGEWG
jgi:hypothetical protein